MTVRGKIWLLCYVGVWYSPWQRSYICPFVQPPRQPATDAVCWPLARRWASSSSGSAEACSSPGSRAPWYCERRKGRRFSCVKQPKRPQVSSAMCTRQFTKHWNNDSGIPINWHKGKEQYKQPSFTLNLTVGSLKLIKCNSAKLCFKTMPPESFAQKL